MLFFSACAHLSSFEPGMAAQPAEALGSEEIIKLSIHYSHMSRYSAFSFELRDDGGNILFSCRFFTTDGQEIILKDVQADPDYMRPLRDRARQHGFEKMQEKRPLGIFFVRDAPMRGMHITWSGGKSKYFNYWPSAEVEVFFRNLATQYVP